MASTANNKPFHTYENVGYDEQQSITTNSNINYAPSSSSLSSSTVINSIVPTQACNTNTINNNTNNHINNGGNNSNNNNTAISFNNAFAQTSTIASNPPTIGPLPSCSGFAVNKAAIESPFTDPMLVDPTSINSTPSAKILSTTDSTGTTRMLTSSAASSRSGTNGQNLVTKLITFPPQSPMDSLKEWSMSTFKCTKQLINEKRGLCPVTNDSQLQNDIEQLRGNREKLVQMLRFGQQMTDHYSQLVRTQKQLHSLMNEMSIKCFTNNSSLNNNHQSSAGGGSHKTSCSKQVVANFSSLSNNLSSTTTTQSPTRPSSHGLDHHNGRSNSSTEHYEDLLPVLNHMKTFTDTNLVDDFKKNAITLNVAINNGEKLITALNFYCSNLSTLIYKTIEDTLTTVKQFESARLEYDAEKNSLNFISTTAQASMTYSSDKVELARLRYEQLKQDVQIKMRFLEENTIKVMHKQLLLFNGAFASYTSGNTAALDTTLKQFCIKDS
uniref:Arfaptin-2 n=1 Tax=Aceria tosichella TaxID=561515 RepID=A0A6G1SNF1_9ACAR